MVKDNAPIPFSTSSEIMRRPLIVLELRLRCDIGVLKLWLIFQNILNGYSINNLQYSDLSFGE
jgi:hypothetical protein